VFAIFKRPMSDPIKHECGIALVRLLKPFAHYSKTYNSHLFAISKLYLMMEKQHNRGQDGAGIASIKFDTAPGERYISRRRSIESQAIKDLFNKVSSKFSEASQKHPLQYKDPSWVKTHVPFAGELLLGHLRYGTFGKNDIESCHPFIRQSNWKTRNLVVAGNFNLTNVDDLFEHLVDLGQHPKEKADTVTIMERIGHFLDVENERVFREGKAKGLDNKEISALIARELNIAQILRDASKKWDGGYVIAGMFGHGDAFVLRDPMGIRPCWFFANEEVLVTASERPAIQTAFQAPLEQIQEIPPGHALIIRKNGEYTLESINPAGIRKSCSFERIYFSRGSDPAIYAERKKLGAEVASKVMQQIEGDILHTVFSFVPNTAEVAFYGMIREIESMMAAEKIKKLEADPDLGILEKTKLIALSPRVEKLVIKDAKLRTFITDDLHRNELVEHVYDITYDSIQKHTDQVVVMDDSIVRGTTLKQSLLRMLDRLEPRKIIIVSSAPQIRYPDCYGIDRAKLGDFIAFQAAVSLLKKSGKEKLLTEVYEKAVAELSLDQCKTNHVKEIYAPFSAESISSEAAWLLSQGIKAPVFLVYQSLEGLHHACPEHGGDWYFSGNYPTPGGLRVVNQAFVNFYLGKNKRAY
jgi:amidophosphoribosyltransferase